MGDAKTAIRDLGRRIAELRAGRGLTQEQLSAKLDVNVQYLQRVERGVENLTVASLARLADLLGASLVDLFAAPASREVRPGRPRKKLVDKPVAPRPRKGRARRGKV